MPQNFLGCDRDQPLLLPPDLRDWPPEDQLAWFVIVRALRKLGDATVVFLLLRQAFRAIGGVTSFAVILIAIGVLVRAAPHRSGGTQKSPAAAAISRRRGHRDRPL
jgi:hypothetical protein